ncbi:MAG TPA: hypothetical protein VE134_07325 [Methanomicrobiales archaeon]|nr:hypothetical protein [Methanomicrobiales archaeon]
MEHEIMRSDVMQKLKELRSGRSVEDQRELALSLIQTTLVQFSREWNALKEERGSEAWLLSADRLIDYYSHLLTDMTTDLSDLLPEDLRSYTWEFSADMIKTANILHIMGVSESTREQADTLADEAIRLSKQFEPGRGAEAGKAPAGTM